MTLPSRVQDRKQIDLMIAPVNLLLTSRNSYLPYVRQAIRRMSHKFGKGEEKEKQGKNEPRF
jgi:hypothetical protein